MSTSADPDISLTTGSEAVFELECTPCNREGQHKEAAGYCLDCGEHLCAQCVSYHKKLPFLMHHQLKDKEDMPTFQTTLRIRDVCTERCPEHKTEMIKYFCNEHKVLACSACVIKDHKLCKNTNYIQDVAEELEDRQDYKKFMGKLGVLTKQSKEVVAFALESKQKSTDLHTKALDGLNAYREELVGVVDNHVGVIRERVEQIHEHDTEIMNTLATEGNEVLAELQSVSTEISTLKAQKHFCKMFVEMKKKEKDFNGIQGHIHDMRDNAVVEYIYKPNEHLRTIVSRETGIGNLKIHPNVRSLKAIHVSDINVKSTSNTGNCFLTGMTLVADDKVALVDRSNSSIKFIDTANKAILSEYKMKHATPWDVTLCEDSFAATLPTLRKIVFLRFTSELVYDREISFKNECYGIDYFGGALFVAFPDHLEVLTTGGVILKRLDNLSAIRAAEYVTVNNVSQRIYVSQISVNRLVELDMDGRPIRRVMHDKLHVPKQMAVDGSGIMYLCESSLRFVGALSPDGENMKILIDLRSKDGIERSPISVCFCENTRRLFVGVREINEEDELHMACSSLSVYQL